MLFQCKIEKKISAGILFPFIDIGYIFWLLLGMIIGILIIFLLIVIYRVITRPSLSKLSRHRIMMEPMYKKPKSFKPVSEPVSKRSMNEKYFEDRMKKIMDRLGG